MLISILMVIVCLYMPLTLQLHIQNDQQLKLSVDFFVIHNHSNYHILYTIYLVNGIGLRFEYSCTTAS